MWIRLYGRSLTKLRTALHFGIEAALRDLPSRCLGMPAGIGWNSISSLWLAVSGQMMISASLLRYYTQFMRSRRTKIMPFPFDG